MVQKMYSKLLFLVLMLWGAVAFAQDRTISGTVKDDQGQPLPGATVFVKGNPSVGTVTDENGSFTLVVPEGATLVVSFVGYQDAEIAVGNQTSVSVSLKPMSVGEVVITALGFEDSRDKIGYASSPVKAEAIKQSGETSVLTGLAGKASGVLIQRNSGDPGAGGYIQIRGQSSITGNLQPLIVLDGVPIYNSTLGSGTDGVTQQSRLNDLNPNDIESVEVLKGAAAAALWGTRAANGVIVIRTKRGSKSNKPTITYGATYSMDEVNVWYPLQDKFGQGFGSYAFGSLFSWGDKIADRPGGDDVFDTSGAYFVGDITGNTYYPIIQKNSRRTYLESNKDQILQKGSYFENNLSISGGSGATTFYASVSDLNQKGVIQNNSDYRRTTFRFNTNSELSPRVKFNTRTNYTRVSSNRIQQGSNISGLLLGLLRTSPDFDNTDYIGLYYSGPGAAGIRRHRSYRNPIGASTTPRYNNPGFTINEMINENVVHRFITSGELIYKPVEKFEVITRAGIDYYTDRRLTQFPQFDATYQNGALTKENISESQFNLDVIGRYTFELNDDINGSLLGGFNFNHRRFETIGGSGTNFITPSFPPDLSNFTAENVNPFDSYSEIRTNAGYASLDMAFKDMVFVNLTGRAEAASTFGPDANPVFVYPSASLAWQFTQLPAFDNLTFLSFGKVRASYGQVGVQPAPYNIYGVFTTGGVTSSWGESLVASNYGGGLELGDQRPNPNLKPERKTEFEIGTDLRFVDDRFRVSATYFSNRTDDLLAFIDLPPSSGYATEYANVAAIENKGLELDWGFDIIRNPDGFNWTIEGNWTRYRNKVLSLGGAQRISLAGFVDASSSAVEGYPLGVIWGSKWERDAQGNLVLDANGFPTQAATEGVVGDPNPDWRGSAATRFGYKGLSLYVLFEHWQGGDFWAGTEGALTFFGTWDYTAKETTLTQEATTYFGTTVPAGTTIRGEVKDFGGGPVVLDADWYTSGLGSGFTGPSEQFIYDATHTRLREVTLSYRLASEGFRNLTKLGSVEFAITGRNLLLWTKEIRGFDPDTNLTGPSNGRGLHYFQNPTTRSWVFSLRITY